MNEPNPIPCETPSIIEPTTSTPHTSLWLTSMRRVLWGVTFILLQANFLGLNYILPTIGLIFIILGLRVLRHDGSWFQRGYILILPLAGFFFLKLIINASIYQSEIYTNSIFIALHYIWLVGIVLFLLCLWQGLRNTSIAAGLPPKAGAAFALALWYSSLFFLSGTTLHGWIALLAFVVPYIIIIRKLFTLANRISDTGYDMDPQPPRFPDDHLTVTILLALVLGCAVVYMLCQQHPMEWHLRNISSTKKTEQIRDELLQLGFPSHILDDLTAEDLLSCRGAKRLVVHTDDGSGYGLSALTLTSIALEFPREREHWKIIHHFLWTKSPNVYGTECIQLWPTYDMINQGWAPSGPLNGQLLYDQNGQTYIADYYHLGEKTYTRSDIFFGTHTSTDIFAAFSLPRTGANYRGYLAYTVKEINDGYIMNSWVNYCHQSDGRWFNYPAITAMDRLSQNSSYFADNFIRVQHALQFYPNADPLEPY